MSAIQTSIAAPYSLRENPNRLKLGLFATNVSKGLCVSRAPTSYEVTWPHTLAIAQAADAAGLDLLVPVARWLGFGGATDPNGTSFETLTWAAGLAASTQRLTVVSTCHVPTVHPVFAAKAAATVDHIAAGRFALNVVMGWFEPELALFGVQPLSHDERYAYGTEWLALVKRLWTEDDRFDFDGRYFQLEGAQSLPHPVAQSGPPIVNAGNSPAGVAFATEFSDVNFTAIFTLDQAGEQARRSKATARERHGREIMVMSSGMVCVAPTQTEAEERYAEILRMGDWEAADNIMRYLGLNSDSFNDQLRELKERFVTSAGSHPIVGTPEMVAQELVDISNQGIDGMVFGFLDYVKELAYFSTAVLPLLREAGVRVT